MKSTSNQLLCPACNKTLSPAEVLAACSVSFVPQSWLLFECPFCKEQNHALVNNGTIALGEIDGAPGPCLMTTSAQSNLNLKVKSTDSAITCTLDSKSYRFKAK